MPKNKKTKKPFDINNMTPEEQLKFEIAEELGLGSKVLENGWRSLTSKESGRIGGLITKRKRELQKEAAGQNTDHV
ncbi:MAG: small, acid-soluble spore protein, alpha/beta type [Lachnospiraceae bacterium]|nr:small, acid-soluble spore protein, alpha/beta type [Lachnospiraceae bacterium]